MKIYTKVGDKGNTSLYDGSNVSKSDIIIDCIGDLDELNSDIGLSIEYIKTSGLFKYDNSTYLDILISIQSQLFDLGSLIAHPKNTKKKSTLTFDVNKEFINNLEKAIDDMTEKIPKLTNFILPGGSLSVASIHKNRTICRRVERKMVAIDKHEDFSIEDNCLAYINRLSDFLFTLARYVAFSNKIEEVIYKRTRIINQ